MASIYHYTIVTRIWHAMNAVMILLLIVSGLSMQYASPDFQILPFQTSMKIHNITGILLTLNYLQFIIGNIYTGNIKNYNIKLVRIQEIIKQFVYYSIGIFKGDKAPFPIDEKRKFNPLQKFVYFLVMFFCVPLLIITGWALLFPGIIVDHMFELSGVFVTAFLHIVMGFFITMFLLVHVYFCTFGHTITSNFKSIITGWHETH